MIIHLKFAFLLMVVLQKSHTRSLPLTRIRWSSVMHRQPLTSSFWAKPAIEGEAIIWSSTPIFSLIMTWRTQMNIQDHLVVHDSFNFLTSTSRPKPAYGRQGLDWFVRPGCSFEVFSTSCFAHLVTNRGPQLTFFGPKTLRDQHGAPTDLLDV